METKEVIKIMLEEIKGNSYINIPEFLMNINLLKKLKIKDLIKEIEKNYNQELIINLENTEVYSYDLVYNYFKLKLFRFLEKGTEMDLISDDFKEFKPGEGYDVKGGEFGDMISMGIIDPLKVTRSALQNAVSVAVTILSTNAIVTMARSYETK